MSEIQEKQDRNFNLISYKKSVDSMIGTNDNAYNENYYRRSNYKRRYTNEEILRIIETGSDAEQRQLSNTYFRMDGYYKQIIIYYATLLKYAGLLIPNPTNGKSLSTPHIAKRYYAAMDFIEKMNLPTFLTNCAQRALVNGTYYGIIIEKSRTNFQVLDLPCDYCRSRFKDTLGNDIIEFNVRYFDSITDETSRKTALQVYPKLISKGYLDYSKGKTTNQWILIPGEMGICFPFFDGSPLLLSVIPASISYEETVGDEQENIADETRKIVVQHMPHLQDGRLVFEPDEAEEMHNGAVSMLKGNKKLSVLTSYADVDAIVSTTSKNNTENTLTRIEQNIYAQAGVSGQIFSSTSVASLEASLNNDLALMMYLANKMSVFITNQLNELYANTNIEFKYIILPVSNLNYKDFVSTSLQMANSGYSFVIPALAMGINQKELGSLKELENDLLGLKDKLIPLTNSFTSGESNTETAGRPKLDDSQKSPKTIENQESL